MRRLFFAYCLFAFLFKPLSLFAQPMDFRVWFMSQVQDQLFSQQTLVNLEPALNCVGSQLTPPNAVGERTKIWDPTSQRWTRVGFGEGHWVWVVQGPTDVPAPKPCFTPIPDPVQPPQPIPEPVPIFNDAAILKAIAETRADIKALDDHLTAHDEKQNKILAFLTDTKTIVTGIGVIVGWLVSH